MIYLQETILKIDLNTNLFILRSLSALCEYNINKNDFKKFLSESMRQLISLQQNVDYAYHTYKEYEAGKEVGKDFVFLKETHSPARMLVCALGSIQELLYNNGYIEIEDDDLLTEKNTHKNLYQLTLLDPEQPYFVSSVNPVSTDRVHDFDGKFIDQETYFKDKNKHTTTSNHPYDSYAFCYQIPVRTFDAKSHLWSSGKHKHNSHYILKMIQDDSDKADIKYYTKVYKVVNDELVEAKAIFTPSPVALEKYLPIYKELAKILSNPIFKSLTYDDLL